MAKLSKVLLNSLFISATRAETFRVTSCNDENNDLRPPALTFQIAHDYFESNVSNDISSYTFIAGPDGGYHERIIQEDDLSLSFDSEADEILLSYTLALQPTNGFQLNQDASIGFGEDSVVFQCRYARSVSATSQMTLTTPPPGPVTNTGDLPYSMAVEVGALGGDSRITISPNHNLSGITPRLTKCRVSSGEHEIFPIHSFQNDVCFDNSRLNVDQTLFGETIEFVMRTFRFTGGSTDSADAQEQTISCDLHLEPSANVPECVRSYTDPVLEYCIRITSSADCGAANPDSWTREGSEITVNLNGNPIGTLPRNFADETICASADGIDIQTAEFQLMNGGGDGVCLTGVYWHDGRQVLFGPDGIPTSSETWIDGDSVICTNDYISSDDIKIIDGHVHESQCFEGLEGDKVLVSIPDVNGIIEHAYASTDAGNWIGGTMNVQQAFDNDPSTLWHNDETFGNQIKTFTLDFFNPISFSSLTIQKRSFGGNRYFDVCLVLDGDTSSQICTDTPYGFAGEESSQFITWTNERADVSKVELVFRNVVGPDVSAQIAELTMAYTATPRAPATPNTTTELIETNCVSDCTCYTQEDCQSSP